MQIELSKLLEVIQLIGPIGTAFFIVWKIGRWIGKNTELLERISEGQDSLNKRQIDHEAKDEERFQKYADLQTAHIEDTDAHFTPRERDELTKTLGRCVSALEKQQ